MTQASDVWAVGISAVRLCGQKVWASDDRKDTFHKFLLDGAFQERVEGCGVLDRAGLTHFLRASLEMDCRHRPTSSELLEMLPELPDVRTARTRSRSC